MPLMAYFCVFSKKGLLIHEEGMAPANLNQIIASLDIFRPNDSRKIKDKLMEYEVRGGTIYLSVSKTPSLASYVAKYLGEEDRGVMEKNDKKKENVKKVEEELDYSISVGSSVSSLARAIKKTTSRKIFCLFKDEISIDELKEKMTEKLIKKNISSQVTNILVEGIILELREEGLETVSEMIFKKKMSKVLGKLIPSVDHDVLLERIRECRGVFSICFVGVNGVGKSTSLAKVCYWLLKNGMKVYIAACDTFRAGAIEQLKTHVERFRAGGYFVGFHEKGYGKDDASVARSAIQNARHEGHDVVLIDTAGRMHNKKNLMISLTKLIKVSSPNHIVYVGEALIGSDSLDHIKEFSKAIQDADPSRRIDSILLTKVDTVDDKIGQILDMTFSSHAPILFLGSGQTNSDLLKIESEDIVNILVS